MKTVDLVVPCCNEAEVLALFYRETSKITDTIGHYQFQYIFVDDGSKDDTFQIMLSLAKAHPNVKYISFSRNFGKEAAMYAGLLQTRADYVIVMDADLQHPPALIPEMIAGIEEGYDCVAARRTTRTGEAPVRSFLSKCFYGLTNRLTNLHLVSGAVDYRIMTRQMVDAVVSLSETQRFSKGIFEWVGFRRKWIPYENIKRTAGKTKWSLKSLFKYAIDGITAFSVAPLRMVTGFGFLISVAAFIYIIITLIQTLIFGIRVPGYVTTLCAVLFLGGIIEFSIGVVGEYLGHVYIETKHRPLFITRSTNIGSSEKEPNQDNDPSSFGKIRTAGKDSSLS